MQLPQIDASRLRHAASFVLVACWVAGAAAQPPTEAQSLERAMAKLPLPETSGQIKAPQRPVVLVDQVGYDLDAPKHAIVQAAAGDDFRAFAVVDAGTGKAVLEGNARAAGTVDHWRGWHYWTLDFSALRTPGVYRVVATGRDRAVSFPFRIAGHVLERYTLSDVVYYFKGQRVSGDFERADAHLALPDGRSGYADLRGGWYDATGDYGVHFAQFAESDLTNQDLPLVVWSLAATWRNLEQAQDPDFAQYARRLLDEATWGADFLVRSRLPEGSFLGTIDAPGVLKLAGDRVIGVVNHPLDFAIKAKPTSTGTGSGGAAAKWPQAYEASFRGGGGAAVAALALASTLPAHGAFTNADYLETAEAAFGFLQQHDRELLDGASENIIDEYCALLAATELFRASDDDAYRKAADAWADRLMARLASGHGRRDWWRAGSGAGPFFSATDAGLPVVALASYAGIATAAQRQRALDSIRKSLDFQLRITGEVDNPFGHARQLMQSKDGRVFAAFFFPHDSAVAPWWQGDNATLASLAAAARMAAPLFADDSAFQARLQQFAWDQLHWILGRNPYDSSMLMGSGQRNAQYLFFNSWQYTSAPGAIINGITAGLEGGDDGITFDEGYAETGKDDDWRWTEQWLPHALWYLYAISLPHG